MKLFLQSIILSSTIISIFSSTCVARSKGCEQNIPCCTYSYCATYSWECDENDNDIFVNEAGACAKKLKNTGANCDSINVCGSEYNLQCDGTSNTCVCTADATKDDAKNICVKTVKTAGDSCDGTYNVCDSQSNLKCVRGTDRTMKCRTLVPYNGNCADENTYCDNDGSSVWWIFKSMSM